MLAMHFSKKELIQFLTVFPFFFLDGISNSKRFLPPLPLSLLLPSPSYSFSFSPFFPLTFFSFLISYMFSTEKCICQVNVYVSKQHILTIKYAFVAKTLVFQGNRFKNFLFFKTRNKRKHAYMVLYICIIYLPFSFNNRT